MQAVLYDYYRSSAAYRVRIALNLKGIQVEQLAINLMPGIDEQLSDDYRTINPQGRVPYYCEGDFRLGQSPAILEYLEERYPEPALLPTETYARARVRQLASLIACDIHPLNNLSVLKYLKNELGADKEAVDSWYSHWINEGFGAFEAMLVSGEQSGRFCYGDTISMADVYLIPQVYNARRFNVDLTPFPTIISIDAECQKLEAFQQAAPEAQ